MLRLGWLQYRQAQEALREGRLEEVQRLLAQKDVLGQKRVAELSQVLSRAFVERGERHLRNDDAPAAWTELLKAERAGVNSATLPLRQALTRLGLAEVRALLEAGEPARAVEAAALLRERSVRQPELEPLEQAAAEWVRARELAERGEPAQARPLVERVRRLLPASLAALDRFEDGLREGEQKLAALLLDLHAAAQREDWPAVLQVSDKVLALAPQHAEARRLRSRAWKAVEPATLVTTGPRRPRQDEPAPEKAPQYLLWIDGVGGYLVCLGNRVTFGQATPDAHVDVPIFADVSRQHATLTRDGEGYLLETSRKVQVNGKEVDRALLQPGDRVTLGRSCQFLFRQPVAISATARLELVSGHRLRLAVEGILLMADSLVLGPGPQAHVVMDVKQPIVLFRSREGLGVRHAGNLTINGQACKERGLLEPGATAVGDDFSLALEKG